MKKLLILSLLLSTCLAMPAYADTSIIEKKPEIKTINGIQYMNDLPVCIYGCRICTIQFY